MAKKLNPDEKALLILKNAGLSRTQARVQCLKLLSANHCILSNEEIHKALSKFKIDLVTVYRTMQTFVEAGLVERVNLADGIARFELSVDESHHHHHVVCRTCNKIEIIEHCFGKELNKMAARLGFFEIKHSLEFYGICRSCHSA